MVLVGSAGVGGVKVGVVTMVGVVGVGGATVCITRSTWTIILSKDDCKIPTLLSQGMCT